MFWIWMAPPVAVAQETVQEPVEPVDAADARFAALEADLATLREQLERDRMAALLAEAEALAASAPPPPPPPPSSWNTLNPSLTAFGEVLTSVGLVGGEVAPGSGPWLRSLELDLRADVDPFAKAVAIIAFHQDSPVDLGHAHAQDHGDAEVASEEEEHDAHDAFIVAPEEVYVDLVALPAGLSARIGQFRQPFGITNKSHPHDLPWTDIPLPITELLGEEGYADVGGVVSWRLPNTVTGLTLQGGALRGALLDPDDASLAPQWLGRAEWFHEVGNFDWGAGASGTGLGDTVIRGADVMLRWRKNSWRSALLLAEALTDGETPGGYVALQVQPLRPLFLGALFEQHGEERRAGGYASYYTSEFLRVRAGAMADAEEMLAHLQLTFVWGSHPVEPYWVNR
jgi:hypothetical protein